MPSSTFLNLPPEKQSKLLEAAAREFSRKSFSDASINQIIKEAGIPRGSFYMYFQDKEELFRYLLQGYIEQLLRLIQELTLRASGDIFRGLLDLFDYIQSKEKSECLGEIGNIAALIRCNHGMQQSDVLGMLDLGALMECLKAVVNPDLLDLQEDHDLEAILGLLLIVSIPLVFSGLQSQTPAVWRRRLEHSLKLLKRGMSREK